MNNNLSAQFLLNPNIIFLNAGSFGACVKPVFENYQQFQLELEQEPVQFITVKGLEYLKQSREALSKYINCNADDIVYVTNPSYAVNIIAKSFPLKAGDEILTTDIEYGACDRTWNYYCKKAGAKYIRQKINFPLTTKEEFVEQFFKGLSAKTKMVFVASPNNPTGTTNTEEELTAFIRAVPDHVIVVFDEAYAEYQVKAPDLLPLIREGRKVICLRTFSKIYGLASLRVGYGYAAPDCIALLNRVRQPFNVNAIGQAAAVAALDDDAFMNQCVRDNLLGLKQLEDGFKALGLEFVPSAANFILVKVGQGAAVFSALQTKGLIVRPLAPYKLPEWIRITVGTKEQNEKILQALKEEVK